MAKHILMIDDDKELCEEFAEILTDEGFAVETVHTGTEGLKRIRQGKYDLLLLDLKIPGYNGFEILRAISGMAAPPRVIVLTGRPLSGQLRDQLKTSRDDDEATLKLADAVLNKPFEVEALLVKIAEVTGASS